MNIGDSGRRGAPKLRQPWVLRRTFPKLVAHLTRRTLYPLAKPSGLRHQAAHRVTWCYWSPEYYQALR